MGLFGGLFLLLARSADKGATIARKAESDQISSIRNAWIAKYTDEELEKEITKKVADHKSQVIKPMVDIMRAEGKYADRDFMILQYQTENTARYLMAQHGKLLMRDAFHGSWGTLGDGIKFSLDAEAEFFERFCVPILKDCGLRDKYTRITKAFMQPTFGWIIEGTQRNPKI